MRWILHPHRWFVAALGLLLWATEPLVERVYYTTAQHRGAFPANADSISIPVAYGWVGWLWFSPVALGVIGLAVWRAPQRISLDAFDRKRPWWAGAWTVVLLGIAVSDAWFAGVSIFRHYPVDVLSSGLAAYTALALRGAIAGPPRRESKARLSSSAP